MCRNDLEEERIGYTNYEDEEVFIKVNDSQRPIEVIEERVEYVCNDGSLNQNQIQVVTQFE